jgi:hypothetical protein
MTAVIAWLVASAVLAQATQPGRPAEAHRDPASRESMPPSLALAVEYADGVTTYRTIEKAGGGWTPFFPTLGEPPTRNGLPLSALLIAHVPSPSGLRVEISLRYGRPHQHTEHVTTVDVTTDQKVRIDEALRPFGVAPIQLSLVPVTSGLPVPPQIESVSSNLHVEVDVSAAPRLRVTVRNFSSSHAVELFRWEGYRGSTPAMSGLRPGRRNQPELAPGGEVTFQVTPGVRTDAPPEGGWTAGWIDRFVIGAVLWEDGLVEGDHQIVESHRAASRGRAVQLARVLAIVDATLAINEPSIDGFLAAVQELPIQPGDGDYFQKLGMQTMKDTVLQDLKAAAGPERSAVRFVEWLPRARAEYAAWLARLRRLTGDHETKRF